MRLWAWAAVASAFLASGCSLDQAYSPPRVEVPGHFDDAGVDAGGASLTPQWWRQFHDPTLDRLQDRVEAANPDLAAALANSQVAKARAEAAMAGAFPALDAGASLSANKQSDNRPLRSENQPTYFGNNQLFGAVAAYEIDIWGRVADIVRAAKADAQASADLYAQARLELHAELARDYVDLRGLDAETALLAGAIAIYREALDLTHSRVAANISPPMDEERAKTQLATAEASASDLALRRASLISAIATLTGAAAPGFNLKPTTTPIALPHRPRSTPGDALLRRPDVAAAECAAAAASAYLGAARAAFYPKFTIGLLGGTQDTGLNLLSLTNSAYALGPAVSVPVFDFGLREADLKAAKYRLQAAMESHRAVVLTALKDVQDSLNDLRWLAEEAQHAKVAANAARKTSDMSMALYRDGAASYLDVVSAQNAALQAERSTIALHSLQLRAIVSLMLALGGGWTGYAPDAP